ncbi:unnamed protein product, partial [Vitis vinifera]
MTTSSSLLAKTEVASLLHEIDSLTAVSAHGVQNRIEYYTAGISGGHINPVVTFGLLLARRLSLTRAVFYMIMQCLGAICGAGMVKGFQIHDFETLTCSNLGSSPNWVCSVLGSFGNHPNHRNRHQPC